MNRKANETGKRHPGGSRAIHTTLSDLIGALGRLTSDDALVVAATAGLINSGYVRLVGRFRESRIIVGNAVHRKEL